MLSIVEMPSYQNLTSSASWRCSNLSVYCSHGSPTTMAIFILTSSPPWDGAAKHASLADGPSEPPVPVHSIEAMTLFLPSFLRRPPAQTRFAGSWPARNYVFLFSPTHRCWVFDVLLPSELYWMLSTAVFCDLHFRDVDCQMFCGWLRKGGEGGQCPFYKLWSLNSTRCTIKWPKLI